MPAPLAFRSADTPPRRLSFRRYFSVFAIIFLLPPRYFDCRFYFIFAAAIDIAMLSLRHTLSCCHAADAFFR